MDKIFVSLTDKNGNNFTYNAHEIKPEEIVENIKAGSLSIDGDKLRGNDNFVIDAKRLKCSIVLPNNNEPFKDAILALLNDETKLIQDGMQVSPVNAIRFNHDRAVQYMGLERMWGRNYYEGDDYANNWVGQTWSEENQGSGKLIIKSDMVNGRNDLHRIIHAICWNYLFIPYSDGWEQWGPGQMYVAPGQRLNVYQTLNYSVRGFELDGVKFDIGFLNLADFLARGLIAHMARTYPSGNYSNNFQNVSYGSYFVDYLNMISPGLGTAMNTYVVNKLNALINDTIDNVDSLFIPMRKACGYPDYKNIQPYAWQYLDEFLCEDSTHDTYGLAFYQYIGDDETPTVISIYKSIASTGAGNTVPIQNRNKMITRLSYFIESIMQYWWYKIAQNELIAAGYQPKRLAYNSNTSYVFLQNVMEAVVGVRTDQSATHYTPIVTKYNFIHDYTLQTVDCRINCLTSQQQNSNTILKIGAPKSKTVTYDEDGEQVVTDSGIEILFVPRGDEIDSSLYIPVNRLYYLKSTGFYSAKVMNPNALLHIKLAEILSRDKRILMDDFNYSKIAFNPTYKTWLTNTAYNETNWMYFNNIGIVEFSEFGVVNNNSEKRVEMPVFDAEGNDVDNYGLYIYKDFFDKYYTKQRSNLMEVYVNVYLQRDGNSPVSIYRGIVDFSSIQYDNTSISFEATDATGLLIENLKKLENFICFSQYNEIGNETKALQMAGNRIGEVIQCLVRNPFPYNADLRNGSFSLPAEFGLNNKVLTELSAEDAFMAAIQLSKQLLYCDGDGKIQITSFNPAEIEQYSEIDGSIISKKYAKSIDLEVFSIETVKKIAGWELFAPAVANYYNSIRRRYTDILSLEVYGQETEIKILDKIWIDNVCYIVTEISYDLRK